MGMTTRATLATTATMKTMVTTVAGMTAATGNGSSGSILCNNGGSEGNGVSGGVQWQHLMVMDDSRDNDNGGNVRGNN